jgi:hypothetical protein
LDEGLLFVFLSAQEGGTNGGTFNHLPLGLTILDELAARIAAKAPEGKESIGLGRHSEQLIAAIEESLRRGAVAGFPEHQRQKWNLLDVASLQLLKERLHWVSFEHELDGRAAKFNSTGLVTRSPEGHRQEEVV